MVRFPLPAAGPFRDVVVPAIAFLVAVYAPHEWVVTAFIIVGHAHYLMTYIYQAKGGKVNRAYLLVAAVLCLIFFVYFMSVGEWLLPTYIAVGVLFAVHFARDEAILHGERLSARYFSTALGFTLFFFFLLLEYSFPEVSFFAPMATLIFAMLVIGIIVRSVVSKEPSSAAERYLWWVAALLALLSFGFGAGASALGVVILLHCYNWAAGYAARVAGTGRPERFYWCATVITLLVSGGLFLTFVLFSLDLLKYFFTLIYFTAWGIAHIVLSWYASRTTTPRATLPA